jgi:hypothetical protein
MNAPAVRPSTIIPVLIWLPAMVALAVILWLDLPRGTAQFLGLAVIVPSVIIQVAVSTRFHRRRRERLVARLAELGFQKALLGRALHYTPHRRHHGFNVYFSAAAEWRGQNLHIAEYSYEIGSGRSRRTLAMTEFAAGLPAGIPAFALQRHPRLAARLIHRLLRRGQAIVDDRAFAKRWLLRTAEAEDLQWFFTPELVEWLANAPRHEHAWRCDGGWLSCTVQRACSSHDAEALLGRLAAAVRKLPAHAELVSEQRQAI